MSEPRVGIFSENSGTVLILRFVDCFDLARRPHWLCTAGSRLSNEIFNVALHNQTLEDDQSAKYRGITITDKMKWGQHISEISSKDTYGSKTTLSIL